MHTCQPRHVRLCLACHCCKCGALFACHCCPCISTCACTLASLVNTSLTYAVPSPSPSLSPLSPPPIQYRMHPDISLFPSSFFYGASLLDAPCVSTPKWTRPFHSCPPLLPYAVFDVADGRESSLPAGRSSGGGGGGSGGGAPSLCNEAEARAAVELFRALRAR